MPAAACCPLPTRRADGSPRDDERAGRLSLKNANHGRFEDAYKERFFCWISASGFFCLCPTVHSNAQRPGRSDLAAARRIDLLEATARADDKAKFSLIYRDDTLKFKADKPTELELWIKHLQMGSDAARQRVRTVKSQADSASLRAADGTELPRASPSSREDGANDQTQHTEFLMIQAAESGNVAKVRALLGRGVSANAAPEVGYTALMAASEAGQLEVMRCLVEASASVDAKMEGGTSAIHLAAMCGKLEVIELLSEMGADANDSTDGGTTPLMLAAMEGHVPVCMKLHDLGADVNAIESAVIPELEKQIAQLQQEVNASGQELLGDDSMGGELVPYQDADGGTHENEGERGGGTVALPGPDLWGIFGAAHAKNSQVNTNAGAFDLGSVNLAANAAIESMSVGLRDKMTNLGGNLFGAVTGNQALGTQVGRQVGVAVRNGLPAAVRDGLEQARNATSQLGMTALMKAAAGGHTDVCRVLTKMGADVNARGHGGMTALMLSAAHGHRETTQVLVAQAARPEIPDDAGNTALEYAMKGGNKECVALIQHLFISGGAARAAASSGLIGAAAAAGMDAHRPGGRGADGAGRPTLAVALGKDREGAAGPHAARAKTAGARGRPAAIEGPARDQDDQARAGGATAGGRPGDDPLATPLLLAGPGAHVGCMFLVEGFVCQRPSRVRRLARTLMPRALAADALACSCSWPLQSLTPAGADPAASLRAPPAGGAGRAEVGQLALEAPVKPLLLMGPGDEPGGSLSIVLWRCLWALLLAGDSAAPMSPVLSCTPCTERCLLWCGNGGDGLITQTTRLSRRPPRAKSLRSPTLSILKHDLAGTLGCRWRHSTYRAAAHLRGALRVRREEPHSRARAARRTRVRCRGARSSLKLLRENRASPY